MLASISCSCSLRSFTSASASRTACAHTARRSACLQPQLTWEQPKVTAHAGYWLRALQRWQIGCGRVLLPKLQGQSQALRARLTRSTGLCVGSLHRPLHSLQLGLPLLRCHVGGLCAPACTESSRRSCTSCLSMPDPSYAAGDQAAGLHQKAVRWAGNVL